MKKILSSITVFSMALLVSHSVVAMYDPTYQERMATGQEMPEMSHEEMMPHKKMTDEEMMKHHKKMMEHHEKMMKDKKHGKKGK